MELLNSWALSGSIDFLAFECLLSLSLRRIKRPNDLSPDLIEQAQAFGREVAREAASLEPSELRRMRRQQKLLRELDAWLKRAATG
jgi:hypothetical protein